MKRRGSDVQKPVLDLREHSKMAMLPHGKSTKEKSH